MHENLSEFQVLFNQILLKDSLTNWIVQKDDQDIDKKIEILKTLAYEIHRYDPMGGKLILMSVLWSKDRLEKSDRIEQDDFYQYLQYYFQTGKIFTHLN